MDHGSNHIYGTFEISSTGGSSPADTMTDTNASVMMSNPKVVIHRSVVSVSDLESRVSGGLEYKQLKVSSSDNRSRYGCCTKPSPARSQPCCSATCFKDWLYRFLPILWWLPRYDVSKNLLADSVAGFTVAIMQVPQGMAYAMLASVPPVVGLYTSFFPAFIYFFFGTSKHGSIGTFALISMLTNTAMEDVLGELRTSFAHRDALGLVQNETLNATSGLLHKNFLPEVTPDIEPIEVAVVVAFLVGIIEIAMGLTRMGSLTMFMSDQMISGLITGTAIQVLTSQLKPMTGANITKYSGVCNTIFTWLSFASHVGSINWMVVTVTLSSLAFLTLVKSLVDPIFKLKFKVPFPAELILVILGTALSHHFSFQTRFDIDIIGDIPTGLVSPKMPHLQLIPKLMTGGAMVSIVGVSLSLSIVMSYAKKHNYVIDSNQELIAYGLANSISSFFSCIPCSISLSRSAVLDSSGGKSQLATLVSCGFLLVVILVLGPLFSALPDAILSTIIVVALRSMLAGVKDLAIAWKVSKGEAFVWLITFLGAIVLDIDYALAIGVFASLATVLFHAHRPGHVLVLGRLEDTELYVDIEKYSVSAREVSGVKVVKVPGPLYFANRDVVRGQVMTLSFQSGDTSSAGAIYRNDYDVESSCNSKFGESQLLLFEKKSATSLHHVVLDCSAVSFVDSGGIDALVQLADDVGRKGAILFMASVQENVLKMVESRPSPVGLTKGQMFPTVHDAVLQAEFEAKFQDETQNEDE